MLTKTERTLGTDDSTLSNTLSGTSSGRSLPETPGSLENFKNLLRQTVALSRTNRPTSSQESEIFGAVVGSKPFSPGAISAAQGVFSSEYTRAEEPIVKGITDLLAEQERQRSLRENQNFELYKNTLKVLGDNPHLAAVVPPEELSLIKSGGQFSTETLQKMAQADKDRDIFDEQIKLKAVSAQGVTVSDTAVVSYGKQ